MATYTITETYDTIGLTDSVATTVIINQSEQIGLSDSSTCSVLSTLYQEEPIGIIDSSSCNVTSTNSCTETIGLIDQSKTPVFYTSCVDSIGLTDSCKITVILPAHEEPIGLSDSSSCHGISTLHCMDAIGLTDVSTCNVTSINYCIETIGLEDRSIMPLLGQAWTVPTDTFAMSRFNPYPYSCIAVVNGTLLAVGDAGISQVGLGGEAVAATLTSGLTNFGSMQQKRPRDVWIDYIGKQPTISFENGDGQTNTYAVSNSSTALKPTTSRAKLGRGLKSCHWRITLMTDGTILESNIEFDSLTTRL